MIFSTAAHLRHQLILNRFKLMKMANIDVDGIDIEVKVYNQGSETNYTLRVNSEQSSVSDLVSEVFCSIQLSPEDYAIGKI